MTKNPGWIAKEQRILDQAPLSDWPRIAAALAWDLMEDPAWMDDEGRARFWVEIGRQTELQELHDAMAVVGSELAALPLRIVARLRALIRDAADRMGRAIG